jgi:hypothetical protein
MDKMKSLGWQKKEQPEPERETEPETERETEPEQPEQQWRQRANSACNVLVFLWVTCWLLAKTTRRKRRTFFPKCFWPEYFSATLNVGRPARDNTERTPREHRENTERDVSIIDYVKHLHTRMFLACRRNACQSDALGRTTCMV